MNIGFILSNIGVLTCLLLGLLAIFKPKLIQSFVGVRAVGKEGDSEFKATYGGFFIGISIYAFVVQSEEVFIVIGIGWLSASFIRLLSMFGGALTIKNFGGVLFEAMVGILCLSIFIT